MFGLFVQKHAEAVSLFTTVKVLYVQADERIEKFEIVETVKENITELIVYYPFNKDRLLKKITKFSNYLRAYWIGYKQITRDNFKPDIVHANILTRTGIIAYLFKLWKKIPYIVTEHSSRYLPNRNSFKGTFRKFLSRLIVKNASAILPVSYSLKKAMLDHGLFNNNYIVVNNVVDNFFFEEIPEVHRTKKRFIHVSCFDEQAKNISGILRATYELSKIRQDFELIIIGTGFDFEQVYSYAQKLDFRKGILHFLGEKTPEEVANWLHNSDCFVLFSNYENSPVVISESLVCGKPVISSDVGGISEHINNSNGILIRLGDENNLMEQMNNMLDHFEDYDSLKMKSMAKNKFSFESIGFILCEIYKQAIK